VFLVAACALVYELALGTIASFTLGDATREFSITLGLYLFAMGLGAFASKRIGASAAFAYVACEIALAIVGGASVPVVMHLTASASAIRPILYAFIIGVGALVGFELPLLIRMTRFVIPDGGPRQEAGFTEAVSGSLASDYAGALLASIVFPFLMVPFLGLVRTTLVTGALNAALAAVVAAIFLAGRKRRALIGASALCASALTVLALASDALRLVPSE
jgi:spermidine synthase